MKKIIALVLALVTLFTFSVSAQAAQKPTVDLLWDNTDSIATNFDFNGSDSYARASIIAKEGTSQINATLTVYRKMDNGYMLYIGESTKTVYTDACSISVKFTALSGATYKSILVVNVTNNGVTESIQRATWGVN